MTHVYSVWLLSEANASLELARELANPRLEVLALYDLARMADTPEHALEIMEQGVARACETPGGILTPFILTSQAKILQQLGRHIRAQSVLVEALTVAQEQRLLIGEVSVRIRLAQVDIGAGQLDSAWTHVRAALRLCQQYKLSMMLMRALYTCVMLVLAESAPVRWRLAARILGAANSLSDRIGARTHHERVSIGGPATTRMRTALGEEAWAAAYAAGQALSPDDAIAEALGERPGRQHHPPADGLADVRAMRRATTPLPF
jgi:hypothetical protein